MADVTFTPDTDSDGYPTEAFLERIRNYPIKSHLDCKELLEEEIQPVWYFQDYFSSKPRWSRKSTLYYVSTAGWSGNESIIDALGHNTIFWLFCFLNHHRGGHYVFEVRDEVQG